MTVLLAAIALLCGIPVGMIVGLVAGYAVFTRRVNDGNDPDYSGGL